MQEINFLRPKKEKPIRKRELQTPSLCELCPKKRPGSSLKVESKAYWISVAAFIESSAELPALQPARKTGGIGIKAATASRLAFT